MTDTVLQHTYAGILFGVASGSLSPRALIGSGSLSSDVTHQRLLGKTDVTASMHGTHSGRSRHQTSVPGKAGWLLVGRHFLSFEALLSAVRR